MSAGKKIKRCINFECKKEEEEKTDLPAIKYIHIILVGPINNFFFSRIKFLFQKCSTESQWRD